jgi:hypothetical protein
MEKVLPRRFRWICSRIRNAGERGRLDRSVWRPAKHISPTTFLDRPPIRLSIGIIKAGCRMPDAGRETRDASRRDRDRASPEPRTREHIH